MKPYPMVPTMPPQAPERTGPTEIRWAVHLGCTTPARLATEWGITVVLAAQRLARVASAGSIERLKRGQYRCERAEA